MATQFFFFIPIRGEMIQFHSYFSNGLKPPTRKVGFLHEITCADGVSEIHPFFLQNSVNFCRIKKVMMLINSVNSARLSKSNWRITAVYLGQKFILAFPPQVGMLAIHRSAEIGCWQANKLIYTFPWPYLSGELLHPKKLRCHLKRDHFER